LRARAAIAVLGLAIALPALACGYCVEDKIAAVYDHAVVAQALGRKHHVAFFAIDGAVAPADGARAARAAAESAYGVDRGSARVSAEAASLSVAFDPLRVPFAALEKQLQSKLAPRGLSLLILRVMERPAELKSVSRQ